MKRTFLACLAISALLLAAPGCSRPDAELAAEQIQQAGGSFTLDKQGHVVSVDLSDSRATDAELAAVRFFPTIRTINCTNAPGIRGPGLAALAALPQLETLYLVGTGVNDAGLTQLGHARSLKTLHLGRTKITDAGLAALDNLDDLQTLSLGHTDVTDTGLVELRNLRKLSTLILKQTKTTPRGVQELRRMLPEARIEN